MAAMNAGLKKRDLESLNSCVCACIEVNRTLHYIQHNKGKLTYWRETPRDNFALDEAALQTTFGGHRIKLVLQHG